METNQKITNLLGLKFYKKGASAVKLLRPISRCRRCRKLSAPACTSRTQSLSLQSGPSIQFLLYGG
jgi:hypothetical protein